MIAINRNQQGAALLIALVILLVVTLIGVSAIKSGIFHERMAFNAQAEELSFQAAETGINGVLGQAATNGSFLNDILRTGAADQHCVTYTAGIQAGECNENKTLDSRSSVMADAETDFIGHKPIVGTDPAAFKYFEFSTIGEGSFIQDDLPFFNRNFQGWRKIGPGSGHFSDNNNLLADSL